MPVPQSVISLYMAITTVAIAAYVSSSRERLESITAPLVRLAVEPRRRPLLLAVMILLAALVALGVYQSMNVKLEAPEFGRTIHPANPDTITVHEKSFDLVKLDNPYRPLAVSDPSAFVSHLANGRRVYYQNCFFCHGDAMRAAVRARANPISTNFAPGRMRAEGVVSVLAHLQSGPCLPRRPTLDSAMRPGRFPCPRKRCGTSFSSSTTSPPATAGARGCTRPRFAVRAGAA